MIWNLIGTVAFYCHDTFYLEDMKLMGTPIEYYQESRAYRYSQKVEFNFGFKVIDNKDVKNIGGGHLHRIKNSLAFMCLLLLSINMNLFSQEINAEKEAILKIDSRENRDRPLQIGYPFFGTKSQLDSTGQGKVILTVKDAVFTELSIDNLNTFTIFLEPGSEIELNIKNTDFFFTGKGATPNNYLIKSLHLLGQVRDSIQVCIANGISPEGVINAFEYFELKLAKFHKNYSDSVHFSKEVDYLLKNNIDALLLAEKQNYLSSFSNRQIDSLALESRLGLLNNPLYQDTLLIRARSMDFKTFLYLHHEYEKIKRTISPKEIDNGLYPIICNQITKERYSKPIQEFLLFTDLTINIQLFGITRVLDSIAKKLKEIYPSSEYQHTVETRYKEFEHLTPGKNAPDFQSISLDEKLHNLKDFKGKVIVIDVWATWCGACIKSFPSISELQKKFKNKDIVFLFISTNADKDENEWKNFVLKHPELKGIHFRIDDSIFDNNYQISSLPRYILIDKKGKIVNAFVNNPNEKLKSIIEELLKE